MKTKYLTEEMKSALQRYPKWTTEEEDIIQSILYKKGYYVNVFTRVGADNKAHSAFTLPRYQIGQLVEELFRNRLSAELQAEGHYDASIIFVYDNSAEEIIKATKKFRQFKEDY